MTAAPETEIVPPPWHLRFDGLILLLAARSRTAAAPGLAGWLSAVAFVDYARSPVGPYRELLHVPRVVRWLGAAGPTVRDIWVDSAASARSGNANWGLTKSVVAVDRSDPARGLHRWTVTDGGVTLADVTHRPLGPPFPLGKPRWPGRLVQRRGGRLFETPVSAGALARLTRVTAAAFHPELVVDGAAHRVVGALELTHGRMGFHAPRITPTAILGP